MLVGVGLGKSLLQRARFGYLQGGLVKVRILVAVLSFLRHYVQRAGDAKQLQYNFSHKV